MPRHLPSQYRYRSCDRNFRSLEVPRATNTHNARWQDVGRLSPTTINRRVETCDRVRVHDVEDVEVSVHDSVLANRELLLSPHVNERSEWLIVRTVTAIALFVGHLTAANNGHPPVALVPIGTQRF